MVITLNPEYGLTMKKTSFFFIFYKLFVKIMEILGLNENLVIGL